MTYTEHDLRELLDERGAGGSGGAARLEEILRRGRSIRRRRRTAGTVLAACAVAVAAAVPFSLPGGRDGRSTTVAAHPAEPSVSRAPDRPEPGTYLPESFRDFSGRKLSLIERYGSESMGTPHVLKFRPTSRFTGLRITCADPRSWVVVIFWQKHGPSGGHVRDSCRTDTPPLKDDEARRLDSQFDKMSAPADWTRKEQAATIWVLPSDARVINASEMSRKGCEPSMKKIRKCDGKYPMTALTDPGVMAELSAELGDRPGRWSVGIYDRPAS
ncbi:hypothetical protein GCM10018953_03360 [Streptosporangium nondiastaticum]|uniref:hypothetical protein n=1 Tax=Streptosporangium nondiastaticum TaxID=35764 RepID=UPI0031F9B992